MSIGLLSYKKLLRPDLTLQMALRNSCITSLSNLKTAVPLVRYVGRHLLRECNTYACTKLLINIGVR